LERRAQPRVKKAFAARVWAVDAAGLPFSVDCLIDNISATGLYLRIPSAMEAGCEISLTVRLFNGTEDCSIAGLRGLVLRNEPQPDESFGIAVSITHREIF
jgi:hypothetical protein